VKPDHLRAVCVRLGLGVIVFQKRAPTRKDLLGKGFGLLRTVLVHVYETLHHCDNSLVLVEYR